MNEELHQANKIRVTNRERTLVDSIHRTDLSGGIEAVIHAIQVCPSIDIKTICKYALALNISTLYGKVGFLIEKCGAKAGVEAEQLEPLRKHLSKYIPYLDENQKPARYNSRWHIMFPERLMQENIVAT